MGKFSKIYESARKQPPIESLIYAATLASGVLADEGAGMQSRRTVARYLRGAIKLVIANEPMSGRVVSASGTGKRQKG